jgi:signal transduction histidine kinase
MRRLFILLLLVTSGLTAREPMNGIPEIRALERETANLGIPVKLEATVTLYNPANRDLMISDGKQGLFVLKPEVNSPTGTLRQGDRVNIEGKTVFGGFIAAIEQASVTFLSHGDILPPKKLEADELMSPPLTLSWVEVSAVIVAIRDAGEFTQLTAEVHGYQWPVMLPRLPEDRTRAARIMQLPVRIRGIVGNNSNGDGQMTSRLLYVQSFDDIIPEIKNQRPNALAPLTPINRLLRNSSHIFDQVRVRGVVTHISNDSLYIEGDGGGLMIQAANVGTFSRDDVVEAEGYAVVAPFRPILRASKVYKLTSAPPRPPHQVDFSTHPIASLQNELIRVDTVLLAVDNGERGTVLHCRSGEVFFKALAAPGLTAPAMEPFTELRLTGICQLKPEQRELSDEFVSSVELLLRDQRDLLVLHQPPWLNKGRLLWMSGALLLIIIIAFGWIVLLRWQVAQQTREISAGIERKAIESERQRVARDLHDTVEQHLTGLAIQVGNIRSRINNPESALSALDLAGKMLMHCRHETKLSIQDLRSIALERLGLAGAIAELLQPSAQEAGINLKTEVTGTPFKLSGAAGNHLLRIIQAAVSNTIKHARATTMHIRVDYRQDSLELTLSDDGAGFDARSPINHGHFGLMGMRERVNKLRGTLSIDCPPAGGTIIKVGVARQQAEGKTA